MPKSKRIQEPSQTFKVAVVEVDKNDAKPLGSPKELTGAILGLGAQLGFQELLRRFRVARALLRSRLEQPSEDENRHQLRALIEAYGFVERQLRHETGRPVEETREAFEDERQEYERLAQFVEFVGRNAN
jgi:hypothetical protein